MPTTLEKNLAYIYNYNPVLCKRILSITEFTKTFEITQNENGEYNLLINSVPVHSTKNAEQEAINIFSNVSHNSKNSLHIIYGLGLGYLYDAFAQKAKGNVIIFEHDIELLRQVLEIVDLTENFSKVQTFIVTSFAEYKTVFESLYRYKTKTSLSALDYHINNERIIYNAFVDEVEKSFGIISHNYNFQVKSIYDFLKYVTFGLHHKSLMQHICDYKDALKDTPAIIVSAGPSLIKNIETLKKYKDNAVTFCVGTAFKTLINNGITPDFLNIIERSDTKVHYDYEEANETMLVAEAYTRYNVFTSRNYKRKFVTASEETGAARWFLEKINKPMINFETKGTVAYHAIYTAKYLGCNPIILVGQDLAYSDGNCYAKGSAFEDLECVFDEHLKKYKIQPKNYEKFKEAYYHTPNISAEEKDKLMEETLAKFNKELVTVNGQNDEKLPTSAVYSLFIEYIKNFGARFKNDIKLINSSIGGAQIDNFEIMGLDEAINTFAKGKLNKEELFKSLEKKEPTSEQFLLDSVKEDIEYLKEIKPYLEKGLRETKKLKKELTIFKSVTENAQEKINIASELYVMITNKYSNQSPFFGMISTEERCEIDYLMKEFDGNMTIETAKTFQEAFFNYFNNINNKMEEISNSLNHTVKLLERKL